MKPGIRSNHKDKPLDDQTFRKLLDQHAPLPQAQASGNLFTQALTAPVDDGTSSPSVMAGFDGPTAASGGRLYARPQLYGEDPAALLGVIDRAGRDANDLVANMEASYAVAQRGYQDAYTLAARIKAGDLSGFPDREAAFEGLRQCIEVASSAWASGQART